MVRRVLITDGAKFCARLVGIYMRFTVPNSHSLFLDVLWNGRECWLEWCSEANGKLCPHLEKEVWGSYILIRSFRSPEPENLKSILTTKRAKWLGMPIKKPWRQTRPRCQEEVRSNCSISQARSSEYHSRDRSEAPNKQDYLKAKLISASPHRYF